MIRKSVDRIPGGNGQKQIFTAMGGFCAHATWRNDKVSAKITDI